MRVQLLRRKRFSRTFHIRSREICRFLLTALHEIWALNLYSYMKNITLIRNSVCHPGYGRSFHVRSKPDHNEL
jgi:hypothetical protein